MIQRIQSFWLLLAACCMAMCFMSPVATYTLDLPTTQQTVNAELDLIAKSNPDMLTQYQSGDGAFDFGQKESGFKSWPLVVLAALTAIVAVASIFLYKNRVRQMRIVALAFIFNVAYVFLLFFWAVDGYGKAITQYFHANDLQVIWFVGAYAPIVGLVFLILAHRGIKRDEAKVRAADRLR
ncbi:MAG: DUF4293 domain-containing protein [Bacteroidales bacterium]|nr:DUF4293 domain-containing protein [Bacteroidales bacterium]